MSDEDKDTTAVVLAALATLGVVAGLDRMSYSYYMLLRVGLCGVSLYLLSVPRLEDWAPVRLDGVGRAVQPDHPRPAR